MCKWWFAVVVLQVHHLDLAAANLKFQVSFPENAAIEQFQHRLDPLYQCLEPVVTCSVHLSPFTCSSRVQLVCQLASRQSSFAPAAITDTRRVLTNLSRQCPAHGRAHAQSISLMKETRNLTYPPAGFRKCGSRICDKSFKCVFYVNVRVAGTAEQPLW
jgi:hypothetical protein